MEVCAFVSHTPFLTGRVASRISACNELVSVLIYLILLVYIAIAAADQYIFSLAI